jgi:hypothetical protein
MRPAGEALESWHAASLGARVRRGGRGQVHSVFARAVNLAGEHGGLTALLAADAPRVAHGMRLHERHGNLSRRFSPGASFRWEGEDLCIDTPYGGDVRVSTYGAVLWRAPVGLVANDAHRLARAVQCVENLRLARSVPDVAALHPGCAAARLRLIALAEAYRHGDARAIAHAVHGLVGLGPGLTPAGDDALIGWLAGIALLGADRRCEVLRQALRARLGRTTDVSRAHLEDALAGEFSEPLAQFANALARTPAEAQRALADLAALGATSGLDAAAGLLAAVEAAMGSHA